MLDVSPAELVFNRFGSMNALARALDKPLSTIQGWKESGTIPLKNWPDIQAAAFREGFYDLTAKKLGELHADFAVRRAQDAARGDDKSVKCEAPT